MKSNTMIKSLRRYNKNIIIKCVIFSFILVIIPMVILAYRTPQFALCGKLQRSIAYATEFYLMDSDYSFHSFSAEERFEELCDLLIKNKSKYIDFTKESFRYYDKECSYGVIINDSNQPIIYCKYHGNAENIDKFSSMSVSNYFAYKKEGFNLVVSIIVATLSIFIIINKAVNKKNKNRRE